MAGKPPGATKTASPRKVSPAAHGFAPAIRARRGDPPPLGRADRNRRDFEIGPRLDLDEGDRAALARDEVDFAAGHDEPPREIV